MNEETLRETELALSHLILRLFGQKDFARINHNQDLTLTKKYYLKFIKTFKHAVSETIEIADKNQMKSLENILNNGEKEVKASTTFSEIDQVFIVMQTKLILQLIGELPDRYRETRVINRKEKWRLNNLRQIQYVQNSKHKEKEIFKLIHDRFLDQFENWSNFLMLYRTKCDDNPEKLIEYLRLNHSDIYREI